MNSITNVLMNGHFPRLVASRLLADGIMKLSLQDLCTSSVHSCPMFSTLIPLPEVVVNLCLSVTCDAIMHSTNISSRHHVVHSLVYVLRLVQLIQGYVPMASIERLKSDDGKSFHKSYQHSYIHINNTMCTGSMPRLPAPIYL